MTTEGANLNSESSAEGQLSLEEAQAEAELIKWLANEDVDKKLDDILEQLVEDFKGSHHPDTFIDSKAYGEAEENVEARKGLRSLKELLRANLAKKFAKGSLEEGSHDWEEALSKDSMYRTDEFKS